MEQHTTAAAAGLQTFFVPLPQPCLGGWVGGCKTSHIHFWCLHGHSYRVTTVSVMMRQMIRRRICLKPTLGPFDSYHYRFAKNQEAALHVREDVCTLPNCQL